MLNTEMLNRNSKPKLEARKALGQEISKLFPFHTYEKWAKKEIGEIQLITIGEIEETGAKVRNKKIIGLGHRWSSW